MLLFSDFEKPKPADLETNIIEVTAYKSNESQIPIDWGL